MAKKKKGKKARLVARKKMQNASPQQLAAKGRGLIEAGDFREAIKVMNLAAQKDPQNSQIRSLLFQAHTLREGQLRQSGMLQEADAMRRQALSFRPPLSELTAEDLAILMNWTPLEEAIKLYRDYLQLNSPARQAEQVLAVRLLASPEWDLAETLPESSDLKQDLATFKAAVQSMNKGAWAAALPCLKSISRHSPVAPVKLVCRAMARFYDADHPGMARALSLIPQESPLSGLTRELQSAPERFKALWEGEIVTEDAVRSLLRWLKSENLSAAAKQIKQMAGALYAEDPHPMIAEILLMLQPMISLGDLDIIDIENLAAALLPPAKAELLMDKYRFLYFEDILEDSLDYLASLDAEFSDPADHRVATSMVLTETVDRLITQGEKDWAFKGLTDVAFKFLGISSTDSETAMIEMVLKAIELDAHNPRAYELLSELPRRSREAKKLVEKGLMSMLTGFPDDPKPCLALAALYKEKNAFRKEEKILKEAMQRAPHDARVKDLHVMSLVKSADLNQQRGRAHLAAKDIEAARHLSSQKTLPAVTAKHLLFEFEQTGQLSLFDGTVQSQAKEIRARIKTALASLEVQDRMKILALLIADTAERPDVWHRDRINVIEGLFRKQARHLGELSSKQIRQMLTPSEDEAWAPADRRRWIGIFLDRHKKLLKQIEDPDVFAVLDAMLEDGRLTACRTEIRRRLNRAEEPFDLLSKFYLAVIEHMMDEPDADQARFEDIVAQAEEGGHRELLRAASRRLSTYAAGPLKSALEHFDFEFLEAGCTCPICLGRQSWDEDEWDEDFLDDDDFPFSAGGFGPFPGPPNGFDGIVDEIEAFIDAAGVRGAPENVIRNLRKELLNQHPIKRVLNEIKAMIGDPKKADLSPEARVLIFGK